MGEADVTLNQTDEKPPDSGLVTGDDSVVWSHEVEVCLFHAMIGHKPVGVNRHFHMICIRDKFKKSFSLPDDIIQEVKEGKLGSEEETKEEFRMEREPPATHEEGSNSSVKMSERTSSSREKEREREKEKGGSEGGAAAAEEEEGEAEEEGKRRRKGRGVELRRNFCRLPTLRARGEPRGDAPERWTKRDKVCGGNGEETAVKKENGTCELCFPAALQTGKLEEVEEALPVFHTMLPNIPPQQSVSFNFYFVFLFICS
ncbi:hypothetical protein F7725_001223, partial [Dissostichus mawsoni]